MYYVGLDLSVNYSSFTISKDFTDFIFGSVINDPSLSAKKHTYFDELTFQYDNFILKYTNRAKSKSSQNYSDNERDKLVNYIDISNKLSMTIKECTEYSRDVIIGIEGMSYGSQGMAVFDIPFLTGIIRRDLLIDVLHSDSKRIFIFSPSELKNAIGCKGNAKKGVIYDAFTSTPHIPSLAEDRFYNYVKDNHFDPYIRKVENGKDPQIGSPFNDIIDSFLPVLKIYNELNSSKKENSDDL